MTRITITWRLEERGQGGPEGEKGVYVFRGNRPRL